MDNGVTIYKPETVLIDCGVSIGEDTIIEPFVQLLGKTTIGQDCSFAATRAQRHPRRRPGADQARHALRRGRHRRRSHPRPYSRIRPGSEIGPEAHVVILWKPKR